MIMMSVHYVYMHVNFTQYLQFVHVLLTSALNPLLWKTVCDCLYLVKPWHLTAKLLIRITRELCSPCSYQSAAPVVVNTSLPQRSPSANLIQETTVSSGPYSSMFHSVGDFKDPSTTYTLQLYSRFHSELT